MEIVFILQHFRVTSFIFLIIFQQNNVLSISWFTTIDKRQQLKVDSRMNGVVISRIHERRRWL